MREVKLNCRLNFLKKLTNKKVDFRTFCRTFFFTVLCPVYLTNKERKKEQQQKALSEVKVVEILHSLSTGRT